MGLFTSYYADLQPALTQKLPDAVEVFNGKLAPENQISKKDWFSLIFSMKDDAVDAAVRQRMGQFYYMFDGVQQVLGHEGVQARMPMTFTIE